MRLKSMLVLCTVSVFCACQAHMLPPDFYNEDYYYGTSRDSFPHRSPKITEEIKEYGKESEVYGFSMYDERKKFYVSKGAKNWFEARVACENRGMVLASPTTRSEEKELEDFLENNGLNPTHKFGGYWLGGHRASLYDPWIWESNGQEVLRFGWMPDEPNGYEGEDCMEFKKDFNKGWNNYYCDETRRYICQPVSIIHEADKNVMVDTKDSLHEEEVKMNQNDPETLSSDSDDGDYYSDVDLDDDNGDDDFNLNDDFEERRLELEQQIEQIFGPSHLLQKPSSAPFEPRYVTVESRNNLYEPLVNAKDLESLPSWGDTALSTERPDSLQESGISLFAPAGIKVEQKGNLIGHLETTSELDPFVVKLLEPLGNTKGLEPLTEGFVQDITTAVPFSEIIKQQFFSPEGPLQVDNLVPLPEEDNYNYDEYDYSDYSN